MSSYERIYSAEFKIDAALSAMHGDTSRDDVASVLSVTPELVDAWCRQLMEADPTLLKATRANTDVRTTPVLTWKSRRLLAAG